MDDDDGTPGYLLRNSDASIDDLDAFLSDNSDFVKRVIEELDWGEGKGLVMLIGVNGDHMFTVVDGKLMY